MKRAIFVGLFSLVVLSICWSTLVNAEELGARLIPDGTVELIADGKTVNKFQSEVPLPDGLLMVAEGNCVVQTGGIQLMARDKSIFALSEGAQQWDLTVKQGHVDFALRANAKPVTFTTPHKIIDSQQAIVPASGNGLVRGYVEVTEKETQFIVTQGSPRAVSSSAPQAIQQGQGITLAQATGGMGGNPPGGSGGNTGVISTEALVVGGGVSAGIITGIAIAASQGGGSKEESPF